MAFGCIWYIISKNNCLVGVVVYQFFVTVMGYINLVWLLSLLIFNYSPFGQCWVASLSTILTTHLNKGLIKTRCGFAAFGIKNKSALMAIWYTNFCFPWCKVWYLGWFFHNLLSYHSGMVGYPSIMQHKKSTHLIGPQIHLDTRYQYGPSRFF